ncbi:MAG: lipopolysaccharide biosynthesis protein [Cyanobacteria bacterium P01_H01_bin.21]
MSLSSRVYTGALWSIFQFVGAQFSSTIVLLILARILGAGAFGLIALASVYIGFVQIVIEQGFAVAIIQRKELEVEHLDTAFWLSLSFSVLIAGVTVLFAENIAAIFQEQQLTSVIKWLSFSFIFRSLNSVQEALLKRDLNFKSLSIRTLGANIAAGITGVVMAYAGFGVWSLVGRQLAEVGVATILLWTFVEWRPSFKVSPKHFRELFSYGISITGNRIALFVSRRADDFLIGYFLGPIYLGYYTIAYRFIETAIRVISASLNRVVVPAFSQVQDDLVKVRKGFYRVTELLSYVSIPFFTFVALLSSEITLRILGDEWVESIVILKMLSFYGMLQVILMYNGSIMDAMGKPDWSFVINTIFSIFSVVTFTLVVSRGINAVAAVYVVRGYLLCPISVLAVRQLTEIDIKRYSNAFLKPICLSLLIAAAIFGVKLALPDTVDSLIIILISATVYIVIFAAFIFKFSPKIVLNIREAALKR